MSIFMLETDALASASSTISSLVSQVENLASNVSGYDTSCEDGFNFDSARSVIAQNIEACATKMQNTTIVLDTVSDSHTQLQNSMKFSPSGSKNKSDNSSGNSSGSSNNSGGSYNSSGGGSNRSYSGGSGGGYAGGYAGAVGVSSGVAAGTAVAATPVATQVASDKKKEDKDHIEVVDAKLASTGYAIVDKEVDQESKKLLADSAFTYKDGYATIGDCFVVACDSSIGKVGDVLQFTQKDGTVVHAVIGVSTHEKSNADKLFFLVDENSKTLKKSNICDNLIQNNKVIKNFGSIYDIRKVSSAAKSVSGDTKVVSAVIHGENTQNVQKVQSSLDNSKEGVGI